MASLWKPLPTLAIWRLARLPFSLTPQKQRYCSVAAEISLTDKEQGLTNENLLERQWTSGSRRTGVIAIKLGMSHLWTKNGAKLPVTLLQIADNQVMTVRTKEKHGYNALQIGGFNKLNTKKIPRTVMGMYKKVDLPPKKKLCEFKVSENALLPVGTALTAAHFVPGQHVDVCARSIDKGFQGVMKRHGMKGQPRTHGVTKTHRKMGATGGGGNPGRTFPGKKMPGRMGGKQVTTLSLKVYRINYRFGVLYVEGAVPGPKNKLVKVTDAIRVRHTSPPPFPTYVNSTLDALPDEAYSDEVHIPHEPSLEFPDTTPSPTTKGRK